MSQQTTADKVCVVIGASHGGVNFAFALRREGWEGSIIIYDSDPELPYHRPPLSKAYLASDDSLDQHLLRSAASYEKENIKLQLGVKVEKIERSAKAVILNNTKQQRYDKLVLATGARPLLPPIEGIEANAKVLYLRNASDAAGIRAALAASKQKNVAVIGGGYIGLEAAASLNKLGASITLFECEDRLLSRVTAPAVSDFFHKLHTQKGVNILTNKRVDAIRSADETQTIVCNDGTQYLADFVVIGVGIRLNLELALAAKLETGDGIIVNPQAQTNDSDIYAIGDCTYHYNPHYDRHMRLESVQNAVDQGKIAAQNIMGKAVAYDALPWFWSDQYDIKLQMVGLSQGYDEVLVRREANADSSFSVWYFKGTQLLAVDAINFAKAYVLGTRFIKAGTQVDKAKLVDPSEAFKPQNLALSEA